MIKNSLIRHWRGQHSLLIGLSLLLVSLPVFWLEPQLISWSIHTPIANQVVTICWLIVTRLLLFPWLIVGVLRSAEHYFKATDKALVLHTTQGIAVVCIAMAVANTLTTLQGLARYRQQLVFEASAGQHAYTVTVDPDDQSLTISGELDFGVVTAATKALNRYPGITHVILASSGGQIYEGRGLGYLIRQHGLSTVVLGDCSSACTSAFIGGDERTLGPEGRLGFHRYGVDAQRQKQITAFIDLDNEQAKDLEFFRTQGVDDDFLTTLFTTAHNKIHYPTTQQLVQTGFVTHIQKETN